MRLSVFVVVALVAGSLPAAGQEPTLWTAQQLEQAQAKAKSAIDPTFHRGVQRLTDSATLIYRDGHSEAEAHTDRSDFIFVRDGGGTMLIGGTIVDGRTTAPGEIRGRAIEGGKRYPLAAGDTLTSPSTSPISFSSNLDSIS